MLDVRKVEIPDIGSSDIGNDSIGSGFDFWGEIPFVSFKNNENEIQCAVGFRNRARKDRDFMLIIDFETGKILRTIEFNVFTKFRIDLMKELDCLLVSGIGNSMDWEGNSSTPPYLFDISKQFIREDLSIGSCPLLSVCGRETFAYTISSSRDRRISSVPGIYFWDVLKKEKVSEISDLSGGNAYQLLSTEDGFVIALIRGYTWRGALVINSSTYSIIAKVSAVTDLGNVFLDPMSQNLSKRNVYIFSEVLNPGSFEFRIFGYFQFDTMWNQRIHQRIKRRRIGRLRCPKDHSTTQCNRIRDIFCVLNEGRTTLFKCESDEGVVRDDYLRTWNGLKNTFGKIHISYGQGNRDWNLTDCKPSSRLFTYSNDLMGRKEIYFLCSLTRRRISCEEDGEEEENEICICRYSSGSSDRDMKERMDYLRQTIEEEESEIMGLFFEIKLGNGKIAFPLSFRIL